MKVTKKSDHKHEYEWVKLKEIGWFTHEKACKICGHVNDRARLEGEGDHN